MPDTTSPEAEAMEILNGIYESWTFVQEDGDQEYRRPGTQGEIRRSRKELKRFYALGVQDEQLLVMAGEIEDAISDAAAIISSPFVRTLRAVFFGLLVGAGVVAYLMQVDPLEQPEWTLPADESLIIQATEMYAWPFVKDEDKAAYRYKKRIPAGTHPRIIGQLGSSIQVELADGQRGFVDPKALKGSKNLTLRRGEAYFRTDPPGVIGGPAPQKITNEVKMSFIDYTYGRNSTTYPEYVHVRLDDGREGWVSYGEAVPVMTRIVPEINQKSFFPLTLQGVNEHILNRPLAEIEARYWPASSIMRIGGTDYAVFRQLHVLTAEGKEGSSLLLTLSGPDKVVTAFEPVRTYDGAFYNRLPLINWVRDKELVRLLPMTYWVQPKFKVQWWDDFKDSAWYWGVLGWCVDAILWIAKFILIFALPRLILMPITVVLSAMPIFPNGLVKFISGTLLIGATYLYVLILTLNADSLLDPLIFALPVFLVCFWLMMMNLDYNRCPNCNRMYTTANAGTRVLGRSKSERWGTYDVYKGRSETSTRITDHYERRSKQEITRTTQFADDRHCYCCGHGWTIKREESDTQVVHH